MARTAGQIKERGPERWLVSIFTGSEVVDGKRRKLYRSETVHGSRKAAEKKLREMLREKDTGRIVQPSREPLGEFITRWLRDAVKPRTRASTYESYDRVLNTYILPELKHVRLDKLTVAGLQRVVSKLTEQGLSARTVRYAFALVNSALNTAERWRILMWNPMREVDLPRQRRRELVMPVKDIRTRLLAELERDTWWPLWCLMVTTGLRPGEALGLQWADIDMDGNRLAVQRSLSRHAESWELTEPKTAKGRRTVPMPAETTAALRAHKAHQAAGKMKLRLYYDDRGLVFADELGGPLDWHNIRARNFRPACKRAALTCGVCGKALELTKDGKALHKEDAPAGHAPAPALELLRFRPYDLRHAHASLLLARRVDLKTISERLGHANAGFTLEVYAHAVEGTQEAAAEAIGEELFRGAANGDKQSDRQR